MKHRTTYSLLLIGLLTFGFTPVKADFKGGRGGGGGRVQGGARPMPAARPAPAARPMPSARPMPTPASRPSRPDLGAARPTPPISNRPSPGLKPTSRPSTLPGQLPGSGLPQTRPATRPNVDRPTTRPNIDRPTTRPNVDRPTTRPNIDRPTTRPNNDRPTTRPGGNRPTTLPGDLNPNRPGSGAGITRPSGNRPKPLPGELGDFLGLDRPVTLPAQTRPNIRPNQPNRPSRPNFGGDINFGDVNIGNNIIHSRPSWIDIDNDRFNQIQSNWGNQLNGITNWPQRYPNRVGYWHGWADGVRHSWHYHNHNWFRGDWWYSHPHGIGGWHYAYHYRRYNWTYWWTVPTYASCVSWFTWSAPATAWANPIYYDYGTGGNVVYQNQNVYINGNQVATADEFAQSAALLATVEAPEDEEQAEAAEWMPLGTFAVTTNEDDLEPTRILQLAVSKEGIISGTLFNTVSDQADVVQGQVDKETQRVAFRISASEDIVVETGLYNLTQAEAPALVHFGGGKAENWLLVRLEQPEEDPAQQ